MEYKAVAIDLDGTLCTDKRLHPEDVRVLKRILGKDVPIIPATTRMRFSTSLILEDLNIDKYPLICTNGARVIGPGWKGIGKCKDWFEIHLDRDIAEELIIYSDE
ncbi:MAG: HAD hydrolase family protein, partial [Candidatus Thermoplasmatota archaeon]